MAAMAVLDPLGTGDLSQVPDGDEQGEIDVRQLDDLPEPEKTLMLAIDSPITGKQKLVLIICCSSSFFMHMGISAISLLLPPEVIRKGIRYEYCGVIFSAFALSIVIFEPLQTKMLPYLGTRTMFCMSSFLGGACYISFALMDFAENTKLFVGLAVTIRFVEGFYYACLNTTSNVIPGLTFPKKASFAFGILEGIVGAGLALGPLIGGAIFVAGGFKAPFLFIGLCLIVTSIVGYFVLQQVTGLHLEPKPKEKRKLMRDHVFIACILLVLTMGILWGIFDTCLEPFLSRYNRGAVFEGFIFAILYVTYGVMTPIWGHIFRKIHIDYRWVIIGPLVFGFFWIFLGPVPSLSSKITSSIGLDLSCLLMIFATGAFVFVFSYDTMLKRALHCGLEEDIATFVLVVASFFTAFYLGEAIGAIIGGVTYANLDFQHVALAATIVAFLMDVVIAMTMLINWKGVRSWTKQKIRRVFSGSPVSLNLSESTPLCESRSEKDLEEFNMFRPRTNSKKAEAQDTEKIYGSI